jgi:ubiquitin-protein ligase
MNNMGGMFSNKEKILTLEEEYHNLNSNKLTVKDFADFYKKLKPKYCMHRFLFPKFEDILDVDLGFNGIKLSNDNIFEWQFTFKGPRYSPYSGGLFHLKAFIPKDYPIKPPEICFITPIYHLQVNYHTSNFSNFSERLGHISSPILNWWDSKTKMKDVILSTLSFFYSQITPESPYGLERYEEFFNNNSLFEKKIKFFTHKYADPSLPYKEYNNSWDFSYKE